MVWSPAIQSVVHRPAAPASAKSVWKMKNRKPHSRPPESESFRKGPRKLYFNKICRRYLNEAWDWFGELALNQTHSSDSPETIRASSICKHPGPLSRLLKWGGSERDVIICKLCIDSWVLQMYNLSSETSV